jgi:hypothetical protein
MTETKSLPRGVEIYLDNNILFNKFGIANLEVLIHEFKLSLTKGELKTLINERFRKEFKDGIEFIEK